MLPGGLWNTCCVIMGGMWSCDWSALLWLCLLVALIAEVVGICTNSCTIRAQKLNKWKKTQLGSLHPLGLPTWHIYSNTSCRVIKCVLTDFLWLFLKLTLKGLLVFFFSTTTVYWVNAALWLTSGLLLMKWDFSRYLCYCCLIDEEEVVGR